MVISNSTKGEAEKCFSYTRGSLSYQKNVHSLMAYTQRSDMKAA
jgi:hypothetical protein